MFVIDIKALMFTWICTSDTEAGVLKILSNKKHADIVIHVIVCVIRGCVDLILKSGYQYVWTHSNVTVGFLKYNLIGINLSCNIPIMVIRATNGEIGLVGSQKM